MSRARVHGGQCVIYICPGELPALCIRVLRGEIDDPFDRPDFRPPGPAVEIEQEQEPSPRRPVSPGPGGPVIGF